MQDTYLSNKMLEGSVGNGNSIVGARPSSQLIHDNQGLWCCFSYYFCCVSQFLHKCTLSFIYIICSTHPTKKMKADFPLNFIIWKLGIIF